MVDTRSCNEEDGENALEPDQVKELLTELKKRIYRHTFRSQRAHHHHDFLSACKTYNRFPAGLSARMRINIMSGRGTATVHAAIDDVLNMATLGVVECIANYYESLALEETRLLEQATTTYLNLLREYPECADPSNNQFIEEVDAKADHYHRKLDERRQRKVQQLRNPKAEPPRRPRRSRKNTEPTQGDATTAPRSSDVPPPPAAQNNNSNQQKETGGSSAPDNTNNREKSHQRKGPRQYQRQWYRQPQRHQTWGRGYRNPSFRNEHHQYNRQQQQHPSYRRDLSPSGNHDGNHDRYREHSRPRYPERNHDRYREHSRPRYLERNHDRYREHSRPRYLDRNHDRYREHSRPHYPERNHDRYREHSRPRYPERNRSPDRGLRDRTIREHSRSRYPERNRSPDRGLRDRTIREHSRSHYPERNRSPNRGTRDRVVREHSRPRHPIPPNNNRETEHGERQDYNTMQRHTATSQPF